MAQMTDALTLLERLQAAAAAAIADLEPALQTDRRAIRRLTVELELQNGRVIEGLCWVERGCRVGPDRAKP